MEQIHEFGRMQGAEVFFYNLLSDYNDPAVIDKLSYDFLFHGFVLD